MKHANRMTGPMVLVVLILVSAAFGATVHEHVIYPLPGAPGCFGPSAPLISDAKGNLYGSTFDGGAYFKGCIFELSPNSDGTWSEKNLHTFSGLDGGGPVAALVFDAADNLYGTTEGGGAYDGGVVFELSPSEDGQWAETVLYNFGNSEDGAGPGSELVFDNQGNLYGTTVGGGPRRGGTVFRLNPGSNSWTETILYAFPGSVGGPDGDIPAGGVVLDRQGRIYGATGFGGVHGAGAVYELTPSGDGYTEQLIFSFQLSNGLQPNSSLVMDYKGRLYGTTLSGGIGLGNVFRLNKLSNGMWAEQVLHTFANTNGYNGFYPVGPVYLDRFGDVYVATMSGGGPYPAYGTVHALRPTSGNIWHDLVLHVFRYPVAGHDGSSPYAGVVLYRDALVGTTHSGGINDAGTVFSITAY